MCLPQNASSEVESRLMEQREENVKEMEEREKGELD
jgi:hypothetical protein